MRFERALHRGAACAACNGLALLFLVAPPPGLDVADNGLAAVANVNALDAVKPSLVYDSGLYYTCSPAERS